MGLDLHASRDLDLSLLAVVCRHTISPTGRLGTTTIRARRLATDNDILDAELEPRALRLHADKPLLGALLGESLAFLLDRLLLLEPLAVELHVLAELVGVRLHLALVGNQVRVRDAHVRGLEDLLLVVALTDALNAGWVLRDLAYSLVGVGHGALGFFVWQGGSGGEHATGVNTGELPGLGDGVEDLGIGEAVDGEIVNGLVGSNVQVIAEGGGWDHLVDCTSVWQC